ncbi:hypothetical protein ABIE26_002952 [Pedobacter africanus]|uniref:hypothetical protein n=1 Tax=Pedobacter africanus TaxID=151894 RepID=UPI0033941A60
MIDYRGMIVIQGDLFMSSDNGKILFPVERPSRGFRVAAMEKVGAEYRGVYDTMIGKIIKMPIDDKELVKNTRLKHISIPEVVLNEMAVMSDAARGQFNKVSLSQGKGFYLVDRELSQRLNGRLPRIEFDGTTYLVDIKRNEFRGITRPGARLQLQPESPWQQTLQLYDQEGKIFRNINTLNPSQDHHLKVVTLPAVGQFDIVGMAQLSELSGTSLVCDFPLKPDPSQIKVQTVQEYLGQLERIREERKEKERIINNVEKKLLKQARKKGLKR